MSYLQKTLAFDEQILVVAKLHWINYARPVFFSIATLMVLTAWMTLANNVYAWNLTGGVFTTVFALMVITDILKIKKTEIMCTNKRCMIKRGIFAVRTQELKNTRIESVEIFQPLWGRILNYGTLLFSGTGTTGIYFRGIKNPCEVKAAIENILPH